MAAGFPVASTNRQTASTFGPIEPAGKDRGVGQGRVAGALECEHTDLGAVTVRDDQFVMSQQRCQCLDRADDVGFLDIGLG